MKKTVPSKFIENQFPLFSCHLWQGLWWAKLSSFLSEQKQGTCPVLLRHVNEHSISFLSGRTGMECFRGMKVVSRMQKTCITRFVKLRWSLISVFPGFHLSRLKTQVDMSCTNDQKGVRCEMTFVIPCLCCVSWSVIATTLKALRFQLVCCN